MPYRNLQQGVKAIREGRIQEGSRLLQIALRSDDLSGGLRATALVWLARTTDDPQQQLAYYQHAVIADPDNADAQQGLASLTGESSGESTAPPSTPPPAADAATLTAEDDSSARPINYQNVEQSEPPLPQSLRSIQASSQQASADSHAGVHVLAVAGPNGTASGFFVTPGGMVATTRFAVSGAVEATITLQDGQRLRGQVVRSFPQLDLALIETGHAVNTLPPVSPAEQVPENVELIVLVHSGKARRGQRRSTRSRLKSEWFPTTFARQEMGDIGGNPIYNAQGTLVGMLTNNANRTSSYVFGVNVLAIFRGIDQYQQEIEAGARVVYCAACGNLSRAGQHAVEPLLRQSRQPTMPQLPVTQRLLR